MIAAKASSNLWALVRHAVLLSGAALTLLPFAWMLATSLKPDAEIFLPHIRWWPENLHVWQNFAAAFAKAPLARFLINGAVVTATIFALQILVAMPCAHALAKLNFLGRKTLFNLVLLGLLIPPQAISLPVFLLFHGLGILDTYAALIAPWTISVFGVFLMRQFFMTVPDDLVDAARMDGVSEAGIVWRIMLPMALPALTAFGVFSVIAHWNDYFWPLIAVNSMDLFTPPLGVATFRNQEAGTSYGPLMAAATVIITPLVAGFLCAQRRFVEGVALTGMK